MLLHQLRVHVPAALSGVPLRHTEGGKGGGGAEKTRGVSILLGSTPSPACCPAPPPSPSPPEPGPGQHRRHDCAEGGREACREALLRLPTQVYQAQGSLLNHLG